MFKTIISIKLFKSSFKDRPTNLNIEAIYCRLKMEVGILTKQIFRVLNKIRTFFQKSVNLKILTNTFAQAKPSPNTNFSCHIPTPTTTSTTTQHNKKVGCDTVITKNVTPPQLTRKLK